MKITKTSILLKLSHSPFPTSGLECILAVLYDSYRKVLLSVVLVGHNFEFSRLVLLFAFFKIEILLPVIVL